MITSPAAPTFTQWVQEMAKLCAPSQIHVCEGSQEEYDALCQLLVERGTFFPLNPTLRPHSFLCRSHPDDVARVEESTFICTETQEEAGPTNNWRAPAPMHQELEELFRGCMRGRTLYVIPFCMGLLGSPFAKIGVQITDSAYVVVHMRIMTTMGRDVLRAIEGGASFVPCMHSVGVPLAPGDRDLPWPCNPGKRKIVHFPEEPSIWSFGSGYGGNALLGKKCLALRIASYLGRQEGWLAEHMLILSLTSPAGNKRYIAAAFPSACGKTNLAMLHSKLPGWKVACVGDDIAWIRPGTDGRWYAMNPEMGMFGVAPGTSELSSPNAMETIRHHTLFTNVALTPEGDVWWEGLGPPPPSLIDWQGHPWTPSSPTPAAHPNARFTAPIRQCPAFDPSGLQGAGVPLSAILFGGRRSDTVPLIYEAPSFIRGVLIGASLASETTAAAKGVVGRLRHDPFAMLPFCGYNMGDYFAHWLKMGAISHPELLPRIFHVNWFGKGADGQYLWPGFSENIRVLRWVWDRLEGTAAGRSTPIGIVPRREELDTTGLQLGPAQWEQLLAVDPGTWQREVIEQEEYVRLFGTHYPPALLAELKSLSLDCTAG